MNYTFHQPTSPIDCDSPPLALDDTIYTGSGEEEFVEEQEAQRQRIQLQAEYYLQGGQLFILSAQLRGPFDRGWVNPWAGGKKRKERDDGPGVGIGRMQKVGDTAGETIPEITKPSRTWLNEDNAIRPEILETRLSSPTPSPAMKSPEGTLSTMTILDPFAEDLQGCLKVVSPSTSPPAFEFPPLIRKDGDGGPEFEKAKGGAMAQEKMFRELNFKPAVDMQKSKATSASLAPGNHEDSPARRLQEFTRKRRGEMYLANNPSEGDDKFKGASTLLPGLFIKTRSAEVGRQPEAIQSQNTPQKRRRLEEDNVPNNADEGAGAPVFKHPLKISNGNEENSSPQAMMDAASPFNVSDHGTSSLISPPKSKPSLFSTIDSSGMSGAPKDGQKRLRLQPRSLGESGFNADSAITETLQFLKASQIENEMRKDTTNP